jgi:hypothetical protein
MWLVVDLILSTFYIGAWVVVVCVAALLVLLCCCLCSPKRTPVPVPVPVPEYPFRRKAWTPDPDLKPTPGVGWSASARLADRASGLVLEAVLSMSVIRKISILTYDTALEGEALDLQRSTSVLEDAQAILRDLLSHNQHADIVCLQGLNDDTCRRLILRNEAILGIYPHHISRAGISSIWVRNSGLVLLSKYPICGSKFTAFNEGRGLLWRVSKGTDGMIGRGVMEAQILIDGVVLNVLNTRMPHKMMGDSGDVLAAAIGSCVTRHRTTAKVDAPFYLFVAGNFKVGETSPDFWRVSTAIRDGLGTGMTDSWRSRHDDGTGYTHPASCDMRSRDDFIFFSDRFKCTDAEGAVTSRTHCLSCEIVPWTHSRNFAVAATYTLR